MTTIRMTNATHDLKAWPNYFEQVWQGLKTFEIRYDDRGYQRGDQVRLREWDRRADCECRSPKLHDDDCEKYSGREVLATIGCVMASAPASGGAQRGFTGYGYVVFSLVDPQHEEIVQARVLGDYRVRAEVDGDRPPSPADVARLAGSAVQA
jgi:hypothetical protein